MKENNDNYFELAKEFVKENMIADEKIKSNIVEDISAYENNNIKCYNNDMKRATDLYSFENFLVVYNQVINIFKKYDGNLKQYNRFIDQSYNYIINNKF